MKRKCHEEFDNIGYCGVTCSYCYVHLRENKMCKGCKKGINYPTKSCYNCKIKKCAQNKNIYLCIQCSDFPCQLIRRMDRSYRKRYSVSLIEDMKQLDAKGLEKFEDYQKERYTCPKCKSIMNMHDKKCGKCGFEKMLSKI